MSVPMNERRYVSIGEVLGLLLEEFPDITISKIRFLESQGLIDPERTPSGYRKFYDADVERLRVILREQREHYLPLKVIKDRLDSGTIGSDDTPTGVIRLPKVPSQEWLDPRPADPRSVDADLQPDVQPRGVAPLPTLPPPRAPEPEVVPAHRREPDDELEEPRTPSVLTIDELCAHARVTPAFVADLESYGILASRPPGAARLYDADAVQAVVTSAALCSKGLEPRHLRAWRTAADKELSLVEQLVGPLLRQHQGRGHEQAADLAHEIETLGGQLRNSLVRSGLRRLL